MKIDPTTIAAGIAWTGTIAGLFVTYHRNRRELRLQEERATQERLAKQKELEQKAQEQEAREQEFELKRTEANNAFAQQIRQAMGDEIKRLMDEVRAARDETKEARDETRAAREETKAAREEIGQLRQEVSRLAGEVEQNRTLRKESERKCQTLQAKSDGLQAKCDGLQEELADEKEQRRAEADALQERLATAECDRDKFRDVMNTLTVLYDAKVSGRETDAAMLTLIEDKLRAAGHFSPPIATGGTAATAASSTNPDAPFIASLPVATPAAETTGSTDAATPPKGNDST